jgi:hypothetical protein
MIGRGIALVVLAACAAGFVRTTDRETSACLYWPRRDVTFTVNPNRAASSPSCAGDGALEAVRAAFAAWPDATRAGASTPCTDLNLADGGLTSRSAAGYVRGGPNENLLVFRKGWCSDRVAADDPCWDDGACGDAFGCFPDDSDGDRHIIAVTTVTYDSGSGRILDADIEVADWDGETTSPGGQPLPLSTPATNGWYFSCGDDVPQCTSYGDDKCSFIDLRNTLTHEVGHLVGLAHVARTSANHSVTMYPDTGPLDVQKRDLSPDDVAGVCAIYPASEPSPTCVQDRGDEGCGGQTAGGARPAGALGLGLALLVLLARRACRRVSLS